MKQILVAQDVSTGYNGKKVVTDFNLQAPKGQLIGLLGPNGVGKSTILQTLAGLLAPDQGRVFLEGSPLESLSKQEIAKKLSLVLTDRISPNLMTVEEIVAMGRMPYTDFMGRLRQEDWCLVEEVLAMTGIEHLKACQYAALSDGQKQKVMIAKAVVQQPKLMILDEPTSHLDIKHKIEVIRLLQRLTREQGITCILSLHDIDLAIKNCEWLILVSGGTIKAQGTPEAVMKPGVIDRLYNLQDAIYDETTGAMEIKNGQKPEWFVVGGNGCGIPVYRSLARKGIGLAAGILHENDQEVQVAVGACRSCILEKAFEPITPLTYTKASEVMCQMKGIIDTGFPIGKINQKNLSLLKEALALKKAVYTLRPYEEAVCYFNEQAAALIYCKDSDELAARVLIENE